MPCPTFEERMKDSIVWFYWIHL